MLVLRPHTPLPGVFNLRDLGGLTVGDQLVMTGKVFRADGLHRIPADQRYVLAERGLKRVVDLRSAEEFEEEGAFVHPDVELTSAPIVERLRDLVGQTHDESDLMLAHYLAMAANQSDAIRRALDLVADAVDASQPVVFHCTAGKDRTGVVAALLLAGLGADRDTIAGDYERSAVAMPKMVEWYRLATGLSPADKMARSGMRPEDADRMLRAEPDTMHQFLDRLDQTHGTVRHYLDKIGAGPAIVRLQDNLLA